MTELFLVLYMRDWLQVIPSSGCRIGAHAGVEALPFPSFSIRVTAYLRAYPGLFLMRLRSSAAIGKSLPQDMQVLVHLAIISSVSCVGQFL